MEQTLGKRIVENRKRLGLTQDQLAEQLGVTAQAVSKWENDQSCPDIATLPRLAEIFGTTTDALLGRESHQTVHTAELVDGDEEEPEGIHIHNGDWSFQWDGGRRGAVALAVFVLLVGILNLLTRIYGWDVSFWSILWPSALLIFGCVNLLRQFSIFHLSCGLFGGYFLGSNFHIWGWDNIGDYIFPIMIVLLGISLLVDALHKPKKPRFHISHDGKDSGNKTKSHFSAREESFECSLSFGENTRYVQLPRLQSGDISCAFGELTVDLSGCETVADDCELEASCSFGQLILRIPRRFRVVPDTSTAFGALEWKGQPDEAPAGTIRLDASVSFGSIEIQYL